MHGVLESNGDWWGTAAGPDLGRRSMQGPAMDHKMEAYRSLPGFPGWTGWKSCGPAEHAPNTRLRACKALNVSNNHDP